MKKNNINMLTLASCLGIGMCLHAVTPPGSPRPQHKKVGSSVNQGRPLSAIPNANLNAPDLPPRTHKPAGIASLERPDTSAKQASKLAGGIKLHGADHLTQIRSKYKEFKSRDKLTTQVGVSPIKTVIKRDNTDADYLAMLSGSFESNKQKIVNVLSSKNITKEELGDVLVSERVKALSKTPDLLSELTKRRVDAYLQARDNAIGDLALGESVSSVKREQFQQELTQIFTRDGSREIGETRANALADLTIALHQDGKLGNILK